VSTPDAVPTPEHFFQAITAFQQTATLRAALEIGLFAAFEGEVSTAPELAGRTGASERGVRILSDCLVVSGFLTKNDDRYTMTLDTATFLDADAPAYVGGAAEFLLNPRMLEAWDRLGDAVRGGGTALTDDGDVLAPENPVWVKFARSMAPLMQMPAQLIAQMADPDADKPLKVLDIAAGHGLFGIAFAERNASTEVVAVDWPNVLEVATENAEARGVGDRHSTIAGSAFDADFGHGYDVVLLTNFMHHFDVPTCEGLMGKVHAALRDGGRAVTLEFVPNEDRISPPIPATFAAMMLATTPSGDAYTFAELEAMAAAGGFAGSEMRSLEPTLQSVVISHK